MLCRVLSNISGACLSREMQIIHVHHHNIADIAVTTQGGFSICFSVCCFTITSFSIISCFYSFHVLLLFETQVMAQYKQKTDLLTVSRLPLPKSQLACACLLVFQAEAALAAWQMCLLLRPGLQIKQLKFPLPCACVSFFLVTVSSQGFESLALSDLKCGETPTVMRGR